MSKRFDCTSCGGPLVLRAEGVTDSLACEHCGAVLDARDPRHQVLARYRAKLGRVAPLPIGARGTLRGEKLEVIGRQTRAVRYSGVVNDDATEVSGHWKIVREHGSFVMTREKFDADELEAGEESGLEVTR